MTFRRTVRPRLLGLLTAVGQERVRGARPRFFFSVGDRIAGDLTVIGHLAAGRVGQLYQVWSAREWCALTCKILSPDLREDRRARGALRREARILRRLHHPNVIRSFGEGEHDGLPYLLMEYLEGPSLFDLLEGRPQRRLGLIDAVRTAIHVGAGVYHVHRRGFMHLDLKPANLLLRDRMPVLVDFDAARSQEPPRRPDRMLGTAPYMAPELVRREPASPATDVYGVGAVLYELLTGRWPFEDDFNDENRTPGEHVFPQLGDRTPPSPRQFNPEIPPSLEETILRCLAPDPAQRYASMHPLLLALVQELEGPAALWPEGVRTERRREPRE